MGTRIDQYSLEEMYGGIRQTERQLNKQLPKFIADCDPTGPGGGIVKSDIIISHYDHMKSADIQIDDFVANAVAFNKVSALRQYGRDQQNDQTFDIIAQYTGGGGYLAALDSCVVAIEGHPDFETAQDAEIPFDIDCGGLHPLLVALLDASGP